MVSSRSAGRPYWVSTNKWLTICSYYIPLVISDSCIEHDIFIHEVMFDNARFLNRYMQNQKRGLNRHVFYCVHGVQYHKTIIPNFL